jgi:peptidyl-prolyl cis-trans isomerase C
MVHGFCKKQETGVPDYLRISECCMSDSFYGEIHFMKQVVASLMICVMLCVTGTFFAAAETADPSPVVATVNGEEIVQSDVDIIFAKFILPQFKAQNPDQEFPEEERKKVEPNIINQLVTRKLLLRVAADANVTADEALVNQQFENLKTQQPEIADDYLRQFLTDEITIQQTIQQEVVEKVTITDEEAQSYYDEQKDQFNEPERIRASHILVQVAEDASQEDKDVAKEKINGLLAQVQSGQDFAEVATEHSDCPSSANGGDLGLFPRGAMVKPFEDVAFTLNVGEISDIVETQFGYHIIKVTEKKEPRTVPFEEVKERLKNGLVRQKANTEVTKWIEDLRTNATIEIMDQ